ncbi:esterase [Botrimarina colliarenosi]|uniref:Esterase n=1 Tax=Botrimarina colliarenosi TaxID=2528001 RepID=A0A5C6AKW5_9BACT|nr:dienelactone hydrolase family protein [Botrimarina colliarenosi]TWT99815.1 esterase [Botrimarina colliarenosi]
MTRLVTALSLLFVTATSFAEEPAGSPATPEPLQVFDAATFDDDGFELPYRLMAPKPTDDDEKRPLLVFLHGFGERGDDNRRQLDHGGSLFASADFRDRHRAFVLMPQCPAGNKPDSDEPVVWSMKLRPTSVTVPLGIDQPPSKPMHAVRALVDRLIETLPIDTDRLYVAGLSMGGYGTWEMAAREPEFWAAAAPICGGGNPEWGERLKDLPLWAFHGDADNAVPVERSREMIAAINAAGGRAIYTEYPGEGHGSWNPTFASRQVWDWMFAQHR